MIRNSLNLNLPLRLEVPYACRDPRMYLLAVLRPLPMVVQ